MAFAKPLIVPLLLTVSGGVFYHLAAKSIPKTVDAALVLVVAYASALAASIAVYLLLPSAAPSLAPRPWHPAVIGLGLGAFLIELGYVLTYRAAWPISMASVLTNGLVAMLLVPIGLVVFGEKLSIMNLVGILLCLTGLALLRR